MKEAPRFINYEGTLKELLRTGLKYEDIAKELSKGGYQWPTKVRDITGQQSRISKFAVANGLRRRASTLTPGTNGSKAGKKATRPRGRMKDVEDVVTSTINEGLKERILQAIFAGNV